VSVLKKNNKTGQLHSKSTKNSFSSRHFPFLKKYTYILAGYLKNINGKHFSSEMEDGDDKDSDFPFFKHFHRSSSRCRFTAGRTASQIPSM
jgi:hypothetical protein